MNFLSEILNVMPILKLLPIFEGKPNGIHEVKFLHNCCKQCIAGYKHSKTIDQKFINKTLSMSIVKMVQSELPELPLIRTGMILKIYRMELQKRDIFISNGNVYYITQLFLFCQ